MAEQDFDRNEDATPYKLDKARERGQVAKSPDVVSAIVLTAAVTYIVWQGWELLRSQFLFDRDLLRRAAGVPLNVESVSTLLHEILTDSLLLTLPLMLVLIVAAVLANLGQTGPILSFEPLKFDLNRLNPVTGFKRIFSMRTLFDTVRSCIKLAVLSVVTVLALSALMPHARALMGAPAHEFARTLVADLSSLGLRLAIGLCLIALLDLIYSRREFARKMRMSRREIKDEHKQRDGDPRIRARLRELRREALQRTLSLKRTRDADVLLTNPTHVAVALRYEHGRMKAPQVIAKGSGHLAAAMRLLAQRHRVPIVRSPALARRLFEDHGVDDYIRPEAFADVARIIVWIFAMRDRAGAGPAKAAAQ